MTWKKPTTKYWDNKFTSYMHDPIDKALDIKGHVDRAAEFMKLFGLEMPNNEFWKKADGIASGFERGQITGYKPDESKSGSVDFLKRPIITHPIGEKHHLEIDFFDNIDSKAIWNDLKDYMRNKIGTKPGDGGYSDKFKNDPDKFAIARFFYTHLALRFKLASDNVGGLGALWHRLPADTRFPDHSIWQHNALVSAIQSCFELANNKEDLGIIVFSITPVQGFIEKARKLRDYWTGSLLLSWLAFEGIKWVIENLGPDHILYPSLIDQPLIDEYLRIHWKIDEDNFINKNKQIASFPNKFLFLVPFNLAKDIANEIEEHIRKEWKSLYSLIIEELGANIANMTVEKIFERQNSNFWDIQWAAVKLLDKDSMSIAKKFLPEKNYENQFDLLDIFLDMIKDKPYYEKSGKGVLYSSSHAFCQSALAAQKTKKEVNREPEPGEKCRMCGEFEVLHNKEYQSGILAKEYKGYIDDFWKKLKDKYGESDFDENEKLCSICLTKRLIFKPLKNEKQKEFVLHSAFADAEGFPSTTYMALYNYFERKKITKEEDKRKIADKLFRNDENKGTTDKELLKLLKKITIKDLYYAILLMDGDKMGKLVNGETLASTWKSIMHPDIVGKIQGNKLEGDYNTLWKKIFRGKDLNGNINEHIKNRLLTPSIHAAISESLGDFALYGVSPIINKYDGKLIYAGGDDVCAVLPVEHALEAADEIQKYYKSAFRIIIKQDNKEEITSKEIDDSNSFKPEPGKLSVNLGKGDCLTISAGILICHHKENLSEMIKRAHELLNKKAKEEGGRNAVAVELRKRSGGSRYFISKWDGERLKAFKDLIDKEKIGEELSRSLAYRFEEFKNGMEAILSREERGSNSLLEKFVLSQLKKSGMKTTDEKQKKLSEDISKIIKDNNNEFNNEGLIIAGFLTEKTLKNKGGGDD